LNLNIIYSCDQSWIFSIITPVFSVTWSFRNHSNMLICCWRNIPYQVVLVNYARNSVYEDSVSNFSHCRLLLKLDLAGYKSSLAEGFRLWELRVTELLPLCLTDLYCLVPHLDIFLQCASMPSLSEGKQFYSPAPVPATAPFPRLQRERGRANQWREPQTDTQIRGRKLDRGR